jgi:Cytochrome c7 and related cytochrome c/Class III cytochrome C family
MLASRLWKTTILFAVGAVLVLAQTVYKGKEEKLPIQVAPQPIPFSHKTHMKAGMQCQDCHPDAAKSARAGLPDSDRCMLCHQTIAPDNPDVQKLARLHREKKPGQEDQRVIEWVRVYRLPGFVFFNHSSHVGAGVACGECHGPVEQREVLAKERSTSMITCLNCHERSNASTECYLCHELGQ